MALRMLKNFDQVQSMATVSQYRGTVAMDWTSESRQYYVVLAFEGRNAPQRLDDIREVLDHVIHIFLRSIPGERETH